MAVHTYSVTGEFVKINARNGKRLLPFGACTGTALGEGMRVETVTGAEVGMGDRTGTGDGTGMRDGVGIGGTR
jgi:hypothetical protein